jgi:PAS domain S-box-containing protein
MLGASWLTRLGSVVDLNPDVVIVVDRSGRVELLNETLRWDLGLDPRHWVGRRCAELVHPEDAPAFSMWMSACLEAKGHPAHRCLVRLRSTGDEWADAELRAAVPDDDRFGGLVISARLAGAGDWAVEHTGHPPGTPAAADDGRSPVALAGAASR